VAGTYLFIQYVINITHLTALDDFKSMIDDLYGVRQMQCLIFRIFSHFSSFGYEVLHHQRLNI
jgi:hypothetical protein